MKHRIHAVVQGRVQGVFFRDHTREQATSLGLTGWVRNLPDGSVESEFEGSEEAVSAMIRWLHTGSPRSQVRRVTTISISLTGAEKDFRVR